MLELRRLDREGSTEINPAAAREKEEQSFGGIIEKTEKLQRMNEEKGLVG